MAICSKCMTGFDSNLERCPKCNSVYRPGVNRVYRFNIVYFLFFFLVLGVGLPISAFIILAAIISIVDAIFAISTVDTSSTPISLIFNLLILGLYFYTIFWSYSDANKRGKPGCLVALLGNCSITADGDRLHLRNAGVAQKLSICFNSRMKREKLPIEIPKGERTPLVNWLVSLVAEQQEIMSGAAGENYQAGRKS